MKCRLILVGCSIETLNRKTKRKKAMEIRKRKYKCSLCKKIITRVSDKQWIKSMCDSSGYKTGRLILIKKQNENTNKR